MNSALLLPFNLDEEMGKMWESEREYLYILTINSNFNLIKFYKDLILCMY